LKSFPNTQKVSDGDSGAFSPNAWNSIFSFDVQDDVNSGAQPNLQGPEQEFFIPILSDE
jgi:hypothetical protein